MSGFSVLDLVAGMISISFLLSIICSSAVEIILSANKIRARVLEMALRDIFKRSDNRWKNKKTSYECKAI